MTDSPDFARLLMQRQQLEQLRLDPVGPAPAAAEGEVVLRLDCFALTTNNITYAVYGEAMNYWDFFPVANWDRARDQDRDQGRDWGQMPVWGYADVIDSTVPEIETGQRYFGYFPTATHLTVRPGKISRVSFRDDSDHRRPLPDIYNWYQRTDGDRFHNAEAEPLHSIYRPLFITAFSLADFLHDKALFGARQILISSASSKTAYATAFCLKQLSDIDLIGLTSPGNLDFVQRTGLYSKAIDYASLPSLSAKTATLYIDIAGNPDLTRQVHEHFGDRLNHDCTVGSARSLKPTTAPADLPGPKPRFFFAPEQIARRHKDWGVTEFNRQAGEATLAFYNFVTDPENPLLRVSTARGLKAAADVIAELLAGRVDPAEGHLIRM